MKGVAMKRIFGLLMLSAVLGGCIVVPGYRYDDDGYRNRGYYRGDRYYRDNGYYRRDGYYRDYRDDAYRWDSYRYGMRDHS
jgi:hypothetical protein